MNAEEILSKLKDLTPLIKARYKAKNLALFGSFVRGDESANSDIDVLVDFEDEADLLDLIGLSLYLEEILQRRVDIVPKRALRIELKESVLREVIAV